MGLCTNAMTANKSCTNSDECQNNKPITCLIVKDKSGKVIERFEANDSQAGAMPMPAVVLTEDGKKKAKVIEGNAAPAIVGREDGRLGYGSGSPSMIRTVDEDPLEKMRVCGGQEEGQEAPLMIPKVVEK